MEITNTATPAEETTLSTEAAPNKEVTTTLEQTAEAEVTSEAEAQRRSFFYAKADIEKEIADIVQTFAVNYATEVTVNCHVNVKTKTNTDGTMSVCTESVYITTTAGQKAN